MHPALSKIRLVIFDIDGTLTDGRIVIHSDGTESRFFDVQDGVGIKFLQRFGIQVAFITGRESKTVQKRAEELGIQHVIQGAMIKIDAYDKVLDATGMKDEDVCVVGDDLLDLPIMRRAAFSIAVANAVAETQQAADYVTERSGGRGAGREVAELILKAQDKWQDVLKKYTDGEKQ